ncbi:hypothetical protein CAEBREN_13870 [Caenorhabditis brenneri]|uniref:Uncharacterized protein n=1 Tax=Caenorhabditis brenneri TaxID=135651 RepID=G0P7C6_CAEBE|nr:hypothetical protein CAEBREN_13870 [Caenorhabditis brenneri]
MSAQPPQELPGRQKKYLVKWKVGICYLRFQKANSFYRIQELMTTAKSPSRTRKRCRKLHSHSTKTTFSRKSSLNRTPPSSTTSTPLRLLSPTLHKTSRFSVVYFIFL